MNEPTLSNEQLDFQEHARRWLAENRPPPPPVRLPLTAIEVMTESQRDYLQDWQLRCYRAELVGSDIPKAYGGWGHLGCQRIANQEMSRAGTPFLINIVGLSMAVPTILQHGICGNSGTLNPGCMFSEISFLSHMTIAATTISTSAAGTWRLRLHAIIIRIDRIARSHCACINSSALYPSRIPSAA